MNTFTILITNTDIIDRFWGGREYPAGITYEIEDVDRLRLMSDPVFYQDLLSKIAIVNDGDYDLPVRTAIGLMQNNQVILNEYYTLVQEDDVLVGNGKILNLHDDKWELEQDFEQEDVEA
jgi:hypothetical protein